MKTINKSESKMMKEVWKMKDKVYTATKGFNSKKFFEYINSTVKKTNEDLKKN